MTAVGSDPAVVSALITGAAKEASGNDVDKMTADSQDAVIQKRDYAKVSDFSFNKIEQLELHSVHTPWQKLETKAQGRFQQLLNLVFHVSLAEASAASWLG